MQILTLDARVDLVPADRPRELPVVAGQARPRTAPRERNSNVERADLADAVRLLNEGTKALEQVRALGIL
jgi:hypothetical protein